MFTDAYMKISIPENGLRVNDLSRIELMTECLAKWLPFLEQENSWSPTLSTVLPQRHSVLTKILVTVRSVFAIRAHQR